MINSLVCKIADNSDIVHANFVQPRCDHEPIHVH